MPLTPYVDLPDDLIYDILDLVDVAPIGATIFHKPLMAALEIYDLVKPQTMPRAGRTGRPRVRYVATEKGDRVRVAAGRTLPVKVQPPIGAKLEPKPSRVSDAARQLRENKQWQQRIRDTAPLGKIDTILDLLS